MADSDTILKHLDSREQAETLRLVDLRGHAVLLQSGTGGASYSDMTVDRRLTNHLKVEYKVSKSLSSACELQTQYTDNARLHRLAQRLQGDFL